MYRFSRCATSMFAILIVTTVLATLAHAQRGGRGSPEMPTVIAPAAPPDQTDYKAFTSAPDVDKKIKLGHQFIQKYPKSQYDALVSRVLVDLYFSREDWDDFYAAA